MDKLKQVIMLMTTQFVLNKIGQTDIKKQSKNEIQKEIENFLKDFDSKETQQHDSNTDESCKNKTQIAETIAEAEENKAPLLKLPVLLNIF